MSAISLATSPTPSSNLEEVALSDLTFSDLIDTSFSKGDFDRALDLVLLLLADENYSHFSKIYSYISKIVKEGMPSQFLRLEGSLIHTSFLQRSSSFLCEQRELAFQIGDTLLMHNPTSFIHQCQAMEYYACGRAMASQSEEEREGHRKASLLLLQAGLNRENFTNQLSSTRGDIPGFAKLLERLDRISTSFCQTNADLDSIKQSYEVIAGYINKLPFDKQSPYQPYISQIRKGITSPVYTDGGLYPTEKYVSYLQSTRQEFSSLPTNPTELRQCQAVIAQKFRGFFKILCEDLTLLLGPPPCLYEIRALGSFGREEMCPFSDIELMILVENTQQATLDYLTVFIHCLDIQIRALGEQKTILMLFPHISRLKGMELDSGGHPLRCPGLMGTPEQLASSHQLSLIPHSDVCRTAEHTILKSTALVEEGSSLFTQYQTAVAQVWQTQEEGIPICKRHCFGYLQFRLKEFLKLDREKPYDIRSEIDLKKDYIEPLYYLLADLSVYWNIGCTNSLDILDALVKNDVFTARTSKLLKETVATLYRWRVAEQQGQKQETSLTSLPQIKKIQWLVLRPLYCALASALPQDISHASSEDFSHFEEAFHLLDLVEISFQEALHASNPSSFTPRIEQLALLLLEEGASNETFLHYFSLLSQKSTSQDDLRQAFFMALETAKAPSTLLEMLLPIPNRAGIRLSYAKSAANLQALIANISTKDHSSPSSPRVKIVTRGFKEGRYVKPEVTLTLIDPKGDIKKSESDNNAHAVARAQGLYVKQMPFQPLLEFAIHDLFYRLWGFLTPPSELARCEVEIGGKQRVYPVLISQEIVGTTLKNLPALPSLEHRNTLTSLTELLIGSILTCPGDGRLSNYVLDQEGRFFCIDNDVSFVTPVFSKLFGKKVNFSSCLFCLYENPFSLDEKTCRNFIQLDVDAILEGWINSVITREEEYQALFSDEEKTRFYNTDPDRRFTTTVLFREGTLAVLKLQFWQLKGYLQAMLSQGKSITASDLLTQLISLSDSNVANTIGLFVARAYTKKAPSPEGRLSIALSRTADTSTTSSRYLEEQFGRVPSIEQIEKRKLFSPQKAKEELLLSQLEYNTEIIQIRNAHGNLSIHGNFRLLTERDSPDKTRQLAVLKTLQLQMQQLPRKPTALTLCHAAILDHKELEPFLHENVTYLDISYCPQISLATVHQIQKKCINLKVLNISGCKELLQIEEGLFQSSYLYFPHLEILLINECLNLKSIKIRADQLQVLECTKNPLLSQIRLETKNFPKISLQGSSLADVEFVNLQTTCTTSADFAVAKEFYSTRLAQTSTYPRRDEKQQGALYNNLGWVYFNLNLLTESKDSYEKSLILYRELHDQDRILTVLNNLIVLLGKLPGHFEDDCKAYREEYEAIRVSRYGRNSV